MQHVHMLPLHSKFSMPDLSQSIRILELIRCCPSSSQILREEFLHYATQAMQVRADPQTEKQQVMLREKKNHAHVANGTA